MIKHNQDGAIGAGVLAAVFGLLLVASLAFGAWAYAGRQDNKNNVDVKVAAATTVARQQEDTLQAAKYAEAAKSPLRTYNGPSAYGSLVVMYPKTWSGYVDDTGNGSAAVDGYFTPNVVPSITDQDSVFALRVQVLNQSYSQSLQSVTAQGQTQTVKPYALPKVPSAVGVEVSGDLGNSQTGTMVILPLRDKTLEIYTEGNQYLNDFNTYILPNFSFSP